MRRFAGGLGLCLGATFWIGAAAAAHEARQIALVIGVRSYVHLKPLEKADADAQAYAQGLRAKGFEATVLSDPTEAQAREAVAAFLAEIKPDDTAAFVFIGHGWSDGRANHLSFADAPYAVDPRGETGSLVLRGSAEGLLDQLAAAGAQPRLAVLDVRSGQVAEDPEAGGFSSGALLEPSRAGEFVVYAAGPGETALDDLSGLDPEPRSLFARIFADRLETEESFRSAFESAQAETRLLAEGVDHDQTPAASDGVAEEIALRSPASGEDREACDGAHAAGPRCAASEAEDARSPPLSSTPAGVSDAVGSDALSLDLEPGEGFKTLERSPSQEGALRRSLNFFGAVGDLGAFEEQEPQTPVFSLPHEGPIHSLAFNPNGDALLIGGAGGASLWSLSNGALMNRFAHGEIFKVAFHPNGQRFALLSAAEVVVLDLLSEEIVRLPMEAPIRDLAFRRNGELMAMGSDGFLNVWDFKTGPKRTLFLQGVPTGVRLSLDGRRFLARFDSGEILLAALAGRSAMHGFSLDWGADADVSPLGDLLAIATAQGEALIWNVAQDAEAARLRFDEASLTSVAFSASGDRIATGSADGWARIWQTPPP